LRRTTCASPDYVDPVAANAPASVKKLHGFLFWLGGIPEVDIEAYRQATARGRTIVAVRAAEAHVGRIIAVLERFNPVELGEPEFMPERERAVAEQTGPIAQSRSAPRRDALGSRSESGR